MTEVTHILSAIEQGDPHAAEQLLPLVYEELRKLAAAKLAQEKAGQTLQATALVHEAYLRLVDVKQVQALGNGPEPPRPHANASLTAFSKEYILPEVGPFRWRELIRSDWSAQDL
jgi:hypothetical protein